MMRVMPVANWPLAAHERPPCLNQPWGNSGQPLEETEELQGLRHQCSSLLYSLGCQKQLFVQVMDNLQAEVERLRQDNEHLAEEKTVYKASSALEKHRLEDELKACQERESMLRLDLQSCKTSEAQLRMEVRKMEEEVQRLRNQLESMDQEGRRLLKDLEKVTESLVNSEKAAAALKAEMDALKRTYADAQELLEQSKLEQGQLQASSALEKHRLEDKLKAKEEYLESLAQRSADYIIRLQNELNLAKQAQLQNNVNAITDQLLTLSKLSLERKFVLYKDLIFAWHPDKSTADIVLANAVFKMLQEEKDNFLSKKPMAKRMA